MDGINTVKFAYVQWVGEGVRPMAKAKASTQKGALECCFKVRIEPSKMRDTRWFHIRTVLRGGAAKFRAKQVG